MPTKKPRTRTEQVYELIRADILSGAIDPGAQLQFARLSVAYESSIGVLREVLTRLAAEGLVVSQAQHGFRVMSLSIEDLQDLTHTRCLIESMVLKDAITHGDIEWEARIVAAHHRLERTPRDDPEGYAAVNPAWVQAHHDFHMALCSAGTSPRMGQIVASLRASAEVYRHWSAPFEKSRRNVAAEHQELLDLALARRSTAAATALVNHLRLTEELVVDHSARKQRRTKSASVAKTPVKR